QGYAKALKCNDRRWTFELREGHEEHTHPPTNKTQIYGVFKAEHKALVAMYIDRPGIRNREIAVELEQRFPDLYFTTRQL
ncbi:hypothetical protein QBC45DRAFT_292489, partial [Copromyces sp. CBS 386.78]